MKKLIYFFTIISVALLSTACNKSKTETAISDELLEITITNDKGEKLEAAFDTANELVTIIFAGDTSVLKQQPSASGINYKNDTYEYTEWQDEVELLKNGEVVFRNKDNDTGKGSIQTLKDDKGELLMLVYDTTGETPTVTIDYKDTKNEILTQTYAWAKGGEYENDNLKWTTNDQGGVLVIDGKSVNFVSETE